LVDKIKLNAVTIRSTGQSWCLHAVLLKKIKSLHALQNPSSIDVALHSLCLEYFFATGWLIDRLPDPKLIPAVRPAHGKLPPVYVRSVYEPSHTRCHCPIAVETYAVYHTCLGFRLTEMDIVTNQP